MVGPDGQYDPVSARFHGKPMVKQALWSQPEGTARTRIVGKPFIVTEWSNVWPNSYATEGPLLMAAYGALQGWDGLIQFDYSGTDWSPVMTGLFDVGNKPHIWAARFPATLAFLRGDIAPARELYTVPLGTTPSALYENVANGIAPGTSLVHRVGSVPGKREQGQATPAPRPDTRFISDTKQLTWDSGEGTFTVNTPRTQGALGFLGGKTLSMADLRVQAETPFCQVVVSSLDDKPLDTSRRMLLTAIARAENTDTIYAPEGTHYQNAGRAPILLEPVVAHVTLTRKPVRVRVLDHRGRRTGKTVATKPDGEFSIGGESTFWYEIER